MLQIQRNRAKRQALFAAQGLGGADEFKVKQMSATVSVESAKKIARAEQETVTNLKRLGYTEEEAGMVHRAAAVKIGELYERAALYLEEEVYHKTDDRKAAWHFFEPVTVEMNGREETFLTNISVIDYTRGGERIFSLELTIENPISNAEGMAAPASGRQALHSNGVSNVRVAASQSFVNTKFSASMEKASFQPLDVQAENKNGVLAPVVCAVEHKKGKDGNRYLVSAYSLDNKKEAKITPQFKKMVYCKYNMTAKFTADAPQGRAYDLLRAAISGGHTANVADSDDIVNKNNTRLKPCLCLPGNCGSRWGGVRVG